MCQKSYNKFIVNTGIIPPAEYQRNMREAIHSAIKLIFERREVAFGETESFAIYMLADFANKIDPEV